MEDLKISPSQILFEFAKEASNTGMCYGFGRSEPYVPFLFKSDSFFSYDWSPSIEGIKINPKQKRKISQLLSGVSNDYYQASTSFICSVAESFIFRASLDEWECNICHARFQQEDGIQHVCDSHPSIFADALQKHIDIISNENDGINNMTTKLQFDAAAVQPNTCFVNVHQQKTQIRAPYLFEDDLSSEDEEEDFDDLNIKDNLLCGFVDYPIDMPISPAIAGVLRSGDIDIRQNIMKSPIRENDPEDEMRVKELLQPILDLISMSPSQQAAAQQKKEQKSQQKKEKIQQQEQQHQQPPTSAQNPVQSPGNLSNTNQVNQNSQQNVPAPSRSQPVQEAPPKEEPKPQKLSIHDLTPDEILEFQNLDQPKKSKKPPPPKTISFIETIPEEYADEAIAAAVDIILNTFVESNAMQVIKPTLQNRKKEMAKRAKEEKEAKKRAEDIKRKQAFIQKRQECLDRMSSNISIPLFKCFVHNEIQQILEDEKKKILAEEEKVTAEIANAGNLPPSILISGLLSYSSNKTSDIKQLFQGCQFVVDEDGQEKIRYRFAGNRLDVLVYLQNMADVKKMLAMPTPMINYQAVTLSLEYTEPEIPDVMRSFNGQEMITTVKTVDLTDVKNNIYEMTTGICAPEYQIKNND